MSRILGRGVRLVQPAEALLEPEGYALRKIRSNDLEVRRPVEGALVSEGVHRQVDAPSADTSVPLVDRMDTAVTINPSSKEAKERPSEHHLSHRHEDSQNRTSSREAEAMEASASHERGHSHDRVDEFPPFLGIGLGSTDHITPPSDEMLAESPTAAEFNIYDTAYQLEVERIRETQGRSATVYLTRRVDSKKEYRADKNMVEAPKAEEVKGQPHAGWKDFLDAAREKQHDTPTADRSISSMMRTVMDDTKERLEGRSKEQSTPSKGNSLLSSVLPTSMSKREETPEKSSRDT